MADKQFHLSSDQIKPGVASGYGGCIATDRITVDGELVGYMYREVGRRPEDGGWRFFAGDETEEYLADSNHSGVYDVNTIANYDPSIVPLLDVPYGTAFIRNDEGQWEKDS
ncbi:MAG: DUF2185 domain-containing protein [Planctomycetota bacterium]